MRGIHEALSMLVIADYSYPNWVKFVCKHCVIQSLWIAFCECPSIYNKMYSVAYLWKWVCNGADFMARYGTCHVIFVLAAEVLPTTNGQSLLLSLVGPECMVQKSYINYIIRL